MLLALPATVTLTACNVVGLRAGRRTQDLLTIAEVLGVLGIVVVGLCASQPASAPVAAEARPHARHDVRRQHCRQPGQAGRG